MRTLSLIVALLLSRTVVADVFPLAPIDKEQNARIEKLEERLLSLEQKILERLPAPSVASTVVQSPTSQTTVTQRTVTTGYKYLPQGRSEWYESATGRVSANHLQGHGYNPQYFRNNSYQEWVWLHGDAHEGRRKVLVPITTRSSSMASSVATQPSSAIISQPQVIYSSPVMAMPSMTNCPTGNCPLQSRRWTPFRRNR